MVILLALAVLILLGAVWWLWNLHGQVRRLTALAGRCRESLQQLQPEAERGAGDALRPPESEVGERPPIRVIIEITDALRLARKHSPAGGFASAVAPNLLKKAMYARVMEQAEEAMRESGHEAEVQVVIL